MLRRPRPVTVGGSTCGSDTGLLAQDFYLLVLAAALVLLVARYRARLRELAIAAVVIAPTAFVLAKIGAGVISSPRPFIQSGVAPLIASAQDNGFPSDHTLLLGAVAAVVTVANRRLGLLFWALAAVVGLARVYARVHHPVDVLGSLLFAALALALYAGLRRLWIARSAAHAAPARNS